MDQYNAPVPARREYPQTAPGRPENAPADNSGDLCGLQLGDVVRAARYSDTPAAYGRITAFYSWGLSRSAWVYAVVEYEGGRTLPERPETLHRLLIQRPAELTMHDWQPSKTEPFPECTKCGAVRCMSLNYGDMCKGYMPPERRKPRTLADIQPALF